MLEATASPENTKENVSQQLNYANTRLYKGRFAEALAIAAELENVTASSYGTMWRHRIIVCAIVMSESQQDYSTSLTYLLEHERDNPAALIQTYLCMDDMPNAAQHLIRRLRNSNQRIDALLSMQYARRSKIPGTDMTTDSNARAPGDDSGLDHILATRFGTLRNRRDVRDAIDSVGRTEEVWLHPSAWHRF